jgi:hypothetical protein
MTDFFFSHGRQIKEIEQFYNWYSSFVLQNYDFYEKFKINYKFTDTIFFFFIISDFTIIMI